MLNATRYLEPIQHKTLDRLLAGVPKEFPQSRRERSRPFPTKGRRAGNNKFKRVSGDRANTNALIVVTSIKLTSAL